MVMRNEDDSRAKDSGGHARARSRPPGRRGASGHALGSVSVARRGVPAGQQEGLAFHGREEVLVAACDAVGRCRERGGTCGQELKQSNGREVPFFLQLASDHELLGPALSTTSAQDFNLAQRHITGFGGFRQL